MDLPPKGGSYMIRKTAASLFAETDLPPKGGSYRIGKDPDEPLR